MRGLTASHSVSPFANHLAHYRCDIKRCSFLGCGTQRATLRGVVRVALRLVAPSDQRSALIQAFRAIMQPVRAAPGFVSNHLYLDAENPDAICYDEEWRSTDYFNRQVCSAGFTRLLALMEQSAAPPDLHISWVADVKGLEYLAAVRRDVLVPKTD